MHEDFITTPQTHYMTHTLPMSADRREWVFNKMSRRSEERCYLVSVVSADVTQRRRCRLAEWGVDHAGGLRSRRITSQDWKDGAGPDVVGEVGVRLDSPSERVSMLTSISE